MLKKFNVTVIKKDSETGLTAQGDATLEGAVYGIYNNSELIDKYTTDENGSFTTDYYICGENWTIQEITPSNGYNLDESSHKVGAEAKNYEIEFNTVDMTVKEDVIKGKISILKHTDNGDTGIDTPENGAKFQIYLKSAGSYENAKDAEKQILTTDEDGYAETKYLPFGTYIVHQISGWNDRELIEDFEVKISKNEKIYRYILNNKEFESYIKLVKIDGETGKTVTLNSATFSLYKLNEKNNEWEQVSCKVGKDYVTTWTTDENGEAYTENKLCSGTYKIEELTVPDGFLELDKELTFEISMSNPTIEYDEDYDAYITVEVENEQPTGTLIVDKSVAIRENVDTSLVDISDLSKIEFKLTAKEDIIDMADGSVIYEKGQEVKTFNVDKDGNYTIKDLPIGSYELKEIKTLDGLVLDETIYDIVFTQEDLTTKVYELTEKLENNTTLIEFSKTDITGDEELEGATLTVLDKDGNIVDTWVSTNETHKIEGLKVGENYILREEITPDGGYVKATDIEFKVKNSKEIQKITMVDKLVEVIKTDLITGKEVEGAELQVIDENGNVIDEWTSTKEPHRVVGLEEGKTYTLIEITCPYGYEIAESITFTVTEDKETQLVEMKDMPILKTVRLIKADSSTKEVIKDNFKFGIYEDAECTKLIKEVKSNKEDGTVTFEDLRFGIYYIKELKQPSGYQLSDKVLKLEINDKGVFIDDTEIEVKDDIYSFTFYNDLIPKIQTGNEISYILLATIMGISLIGITTGIIVLKRKNRKDK